MQTEILEIEYPVPLEEKIYVTSFMREAQKRTFAVHRGGAIVVYTGEAGTGKTTTALEICRTLERQFDSSNPNAFRAVHFEFGRIYIGQGNESKRAIRSVYDAVGLNLPEGDYNTMTVEGLAALLVEFLQLQRIQMIYADEAGLVSFEAIGGLVTLVNVAKNMKWPLTLILIGMDDLPIKLKRRQQTNRRAFEWIYFNRYGLKDTIRLLKVMHPYFDELDEHSKEGKDQFKFMHEITLGLPGFMFPFICRFDYRWRGLKNLQPINTAFLQMVHMLTLESMQNAVELSKHGYIEEKVENGKTSRKTSK